MKASLARGVYAVGGAVLLLSLFGSGTAAAVNEYKGQTYADAANAISQSGGTPVISTRFGEFLPTPQCIVSGSRNSSSLDSSGNARGSIVLLDLNCNYMFALPGVPGNSLGSPEGRAAREQAEQQAAEAQAKAEAEAEQAAAEQAAAGG